MFGKSSITFLLILSIISSTFYLSVFVPRAQAFLGIADFGFTVDISAKAKQIVDGIAMVLAAKLVDNMVKSTVNWAQTGFEGNPAYVTDPKQYFTKLSDGIAGDFIARSDLSFLCSPFQTQVRLALQKQYIQEPYFQCTLSQVVNNIDAFYNDFSQGGWDGWFVMTQNNANNPYGAFLEAKIEMDSRIAKAVGLENQQLDWNQGFLSWSDCIKENPDTGECLERGPVQTPGATIKAGLDKILPSPVEKLINVNHVEQLISAFATGLLTRYVFGSEGLFAGSGYTPPSSTPPSGSTEGVLDIDGDGTIDGIDTNGDRRLDICYFGGIGDDLTGPPCAGSAEVLTPSTSSPPTGEDPTLCLGVTQQGVMNILQGYAPSSTSLQQALPALQSAFGSQVFVFGNTGDAIDKINFGGGMIVDVISDASGPNPSWSWTVNSPCDSEGGGGGTPPASLLSDVQAERVKYGTPMTPTEIGKLLNAVAWKNKDAGWMLVGKTGGTNCPSPSGALISCDYLVYQPTIAGYDVFTDVEGAGTPTWSGPDATLPGLIADGSRTFVAPVQP